MWTRKIERSPTGFSQPILSEPNHDRNATVPAENSGVGRECPTHKKTTREALVDSLEASVEAHTGLENAGLADA